MVSCARCGKEIKAALMSRTKVWTPKVGEFKGKQICQECYDQIQPELVKLLQEQQQDTAKRPIIDHGAQLKIERIEIENEIENILNNYERSLKGSKLSTIGLALTDDRAMWNVTLLKSIGELIKASLYYDELLLRKLDAIQEQLAGTEIKKNTSG